MRYESVRYSFQPGDIIRITGQISEEPTTIENRQKITIGQVRVYIDRFPEYHYGERLKAEGEVAEGKGGYFLKNPKVEKVEEVEGVVKVKERILETFRKYLPQPHEALLSGIVLGTKSSLENSFFESLRTTGTLHVVVASGANIAFFSGTLLNISAFLWGRKRSIFICFVLILLYVFLVGFQPPIVRAAVMGAVAFIGLYLGKETAALRALVVAGILMLFVNPLWLFDLGFQLSFAATATMVAFAKRFTLILDGFTLIPKVFREALSTTLAAQIGVTPLIFLNFGEISLISPLVNMLVLPVVPLIMAGGFVLGILGLFGGFGSQILAWFLWLPLEWFVQIVSLFGNF